MDQVSASSRWDDWLLGNLYPHNNIQVIYARPPEFLLIHPLDLRAAVALLRALDRLSGRANGSQQSACHRCQFISDAGDRSPDVPFDAVGARCDRLAAHGASFCSARHDLVGLRRVWITQESAKGRG